MDRKKCVITLLLFSLYSFPSKADECSSNGGNISGVTNADIDKIVAAYNIDKDYLLMETPFDSYGSEDIGLSEFAKLVGMYEKENCIIQETVDGATNRIVKYYPMDDARYNTLWDKEDPLNDVKTDFLKRNYYRRTLKKNSETGRVVYLDNRVKREGEMPSDESTSEYSNLLFQKLGLPEEEIGEIKVERVSLDYHQKDVGVIESGRHVQTYVRISREVNGTEVYGSQMLVRIGPNMQIQKIEVNWPKFILKENSRLLCDVELREEIETVASNWSGIADYWLVYIQEKENGITYYVPELIIKEEDAVNEEEITKTGRIVFIPLARQED